MSQPFILVYRLEPERIARAIEEVALREPLPDKLTGNLIFSVTLLDGTFLPSVTPHPLEDYRYWVRPTDHPPFLRGSSYESWSHHRNTISLDEFKYVHPPRHFLPEPIFEAILAAGYRGTDDFALRVRMRDNTQFVLWPGFPVHYLPPPDGYTWNDVVETYPGYAHSHPASKSLPCIHPTTLFHCLVPGLSFARPIRDATAAERARALAQEFDTPPPLPWPSPKP